MKSLKNLSYYNREEKIDIDNPSQPCVLSTMPEDILKYAIGSMMDPCDKISLGRTSRFFDKMMPSGNNLLQAIVNGDLKNVKTATNILAHEHVLKGALLLNRYTVTDYSGRRIHQTAYQAALAAEDEEIAAIIQEHLLRYHGPDVVKAQQNALFPEWEKKEWKIRQQNDLHALKTIIEAIEKGDVTEERVDLRSILNMDETCERAILDFRKHLDSCKDNLITTGLHWNATLMQQALDLYAENYPLFGGSWLNPKNILFWRQVIGYIGRYAPANYAQVLAQGICYITKVNEKCNRSFDFRYYGGSYFPLDSDPKYRLGYDYAGTMANYPGRGYPVHVDYLAQELRCFCQAKTVKLTNLCNISTKTNCVIL